MFNIPPREIPRTGDDSPVASLWAYVLRMTGRHQLAACLAAVAIAVLGLAPIELQRRMIDDAISVGDARMLVTLAAVYAAVVVVHKLAKWLFGLYQGWLGESAVLYTRRHLLGLYRARAAERGARPGEAVSVINAEVDKLGSFVGQGPSQAAANAAMLLSVLAYMLAVEPRIALLGLGLLVPQLLLVPLIQRKLNALTEERLGMLRELGDSIADESANGSGPDPEGERRLDAIYDNRIRFLCWKHLMKALLNLLNQLAPLGVLVWAGWLVIEGETTVGVVVAFLSGFERISGPARELIALYRTAQQAAVQHRMIGAWM
ncbi:hypothetical protein LNKW23_27190 [Paralimibaculum aggregatum]|uniref:ABC transmembrane type-1 domain-containing protein n=1 Tax=Paralimibaculum aggregatum TaxID=3036245 RepID=A0ABQ6LJR8_9RHOB|nr:ABC transporter transmembrane domain-containing protein [Limibaculum sp. NKW23]GMG83506.1 hypothetical protein LNKW23_27190 [Limibaculum sp. NKW23]